MNLSIKDYYKSLQPNEINTADSFFREIGIDTSLSNFNYSAAKPQSAKLSYEFNEFETKSMMDLHNNTTGDSEYRSNYQGKSSKN